MRPSLDKLLFARPSPSTVKAHAVHAVPIYIHLRVADPRLVSLPHELDVLLQPQLKLQHASLLLQLLAVFLAPVQRCLRAAILP